MLAGQAFNGKVIARPKLGCLYFSEVNMSSDRDRRQDDCRQMDLDVYPNTPRCVVVACFIGAVALVITVAFIVVEATCLEWRHRWFLYVLIFFWSVLPPLWFWYEYHFIFKHVGKRSNPRSFDLFKHGQQTGAAIWAGALASMVGVATVTKDLGPWDTKARQGVDLLHKAIIEKLSDEPLTAQEIAKRLDFDDEVIEPHLKYLQAKTRVKQDGERWSAP
jgi:hypothetical protein